MYRGKFIIAVFILLLIPQFCGAVYEWGITTLTNGPDLTSEFSSIVCDPQNSNTVWVGTSSFPELIEPAPPGDGLFKSVDKGATWTQIADGVLTDDLNVMGIAIDPTNSNIVYVATNIGGMFKTTDGGASWSEINNGIVYKGLTFPNDNWCAFAVGVNPNNTSMVFASVANLNNIDIAVGAGDHPGLFKSVDGGASWSECNQGLPSRFDPLTVFDMVSHVSVVSSIAFLPQMNNVVVLGMADLEANANLLLGKNAVSNGRVFYSLNAGQGNWTEASGGLPQIVVAPEGLLDFARISGSIMFVSCAGGGGIGIYGSHLGIAANVTLEAGEFYSCGRGVYFNGGGGNWARRSDGLPVANDDLNRDATNTGPVAISPTNPKILLVGVITSDMGQETINNSKVWASQNGGVSWTKHWDIGMSYSPTFGYSESNVPFVAFNNNQTAVFSSVYWSDWLQEDPFNDDNGIYRLPPP